MAGENKTGSSSLDLEPNIAGMLSYLGGWISGIVILILEQKNRFVRFSAAQSIVVFGFLNLVLIIIDQIPFVGRYLAGGIGILILILWIVLMVKTYQNQLYKLPVAADIAEKLSSSGFAAGRAEVSEATGKAQPASEAAPGIALTDAEKKTPDTTETKISRRSEEERDSDYFKTTRTERTIASSMAIFWSFAFLIFLVFYNRYIAFYELQKGGDTTTWITHPILTSEFNTWLPLIGVVLVLAIAGHIILIIFDKYILHELVNIVLMLLFMGAFVQLLQLFPFNFSALPVNNLATVLPPIVRIALVVIILALGISAVVRIIKFIVILARGKYNRQAT